MEIQLNKIEKYEAIYWPIRTMIFYIVMLALWKTIFAYHNDFDGIWSAVKNGLRLDMSMVGGIILISFIPWVLYLFTGYRWLNKLILYVNVIIWIGVCITEFSSVLMFKEWGSSLDARAISYLANPREAWATSAGFISFWPCLMGLFILVSGWKRLTLHYDQWQPIRSYYFQSWLWVVFVGPLAFLLLRGGWGKWPITPSDAFYSNDMARNFNAVNKPWYLVYSWVKESKLEPKYSDKELDEFYEKSYRPQLSECNGDSIPDFKDKNIFLIITEGWSADMVSYLGGHESVTPFFDSLASVSVRFDSIYASGFRTDQGLASILSGIPSVNGYNFFNQLNKAKAFPSLERELSKADYKSAFVYGGDPNFANLSNYLRHQGFDTLVTKSEMSLSSSKTEWGIPDHITADIAFQVADQIKGKFFMSWLQLSSHLPFEIPIPNKWNGKDIPGRYKASCAYSDTALRMFFQKAKKSEWFHNTIFVITSDHGSNHSGLDNQSDERYRVPFIIYDPTDSLSSRVIHTIGNHFDLPKTICILLGQSESSFLYSRDLMDTCRKSQAYWSNDLKMSTVNGSNDNEASLMIDHVKRWYNELGK